MKMKDHDLFEEFLSGTLSDKDCSEFNKRLKEEPGFLLNFEEYKKTTALLERNFGHKEELAAVKKTIRKKSDEFFQRNQKPRVKVFKPWAYAAAATILVVIGVFWFNTEPELPPSYNDYNQHPSLALISRSESAPDYKKTEEAFNSGLFEEAYILLAQLRILEPQNLQFYLYQSICMIETGRYSEADKLLYHLANRNSAYRYQALWYMALNSLKQEKYSSCSRMLKQLPPEAEMYKKAQKLLEELPQIDGN